MTVLSKESLSDIQSQLWNATRPENPQHLDSLATIMVTVTVWRAKDASSPAPRTPFVESLSPSFSKAIYQAGGITSESPVTRPSGRSIFNFSRNNFCSLPNDLTARRHSRGRGMKKLANEAAIEEHVLPESQTVGQTRSFWDHFLNLTDGFSLSDFCEPCDSR